jgi:hypothetical protein
MLNFCKILYLSKFKIDCRMSVDPVNISKPNSVVEFFFVTLVILDGRIEAVTRDHRVYVESNSIL